MKEETFEAEVEALLNLNHPNIVKMTDFSRDAVRMKFTGQKSKVMYIVQEYASGKELTD